MGDIAQILGPTATSVPASGSKAVGIAGMSKEVLGLLKGKNQDASSASLPPIVPSFVKESSKARGETEDVKVKIGTKWVSSSKRARPWTWAPFASSSRTDGAMFRHWVRKNVEYTDYPYAKFDVHMDPVMYTSEEYAIHLQSETWTKSETDRLMELARTFECRWPVIMDRFSLEYHNASNQPRRKIEDLQHRYYGVAAILAQARIAQEAAIEARALSVAAKSAAASTSAPTASTAKQSTSSNAPKSSTTILTPSNAVVAGAQASSATKETQQQNQQEKAENLLLESAAARALATSSKSHQPIIAHIGTGTTNKLFDFKREQERRQHIDRLWRRSKEDEEEESQLRKELKVIDAQLRKLKKNGGHILALGSSKSSSSSGAGRLGAALATSSNVVSGAIRSMSTLPGSHGPSRSATPILAPTMKSASITTGPGVGGVDPTTSSDNANKFSETITNHSAGTGTDLVESSDVLNQYFASTAPVPMPCHPYLQSGRLLPPSSGGPSGINKSLLVKMDQVLEELNINNRPLPTKRICDLYDTVRKDILTLVSLQKMLLQREGQLQSKRLRLSRMGGTIVGPDDKVLDEERLLGIAHTPKSTTSNSTSGATSGSTPSKSKTTTTTKKKSSSASGNLQKGKTAPSKKTGAGAVDAKGNNVSGSGATGTTKKKTVKRKRKTGETGTSKNTGAVGGTKTPAIGSTAAKATTAAKVSAARAAATATTSAKSASGGTAVATKGTGATVVVNCTDPSTTPINAAIGAGTKTTTAKTPKAGLSNNVVTGSAAKRSRKS